MNVFMKVAVFIATDTSNLLIIFKKKPPVIKYLFCMISCILGLDNDSNDPENYY